MKRLLPILAGFIIAGCGATIRTYDGERFFRAFVDTLNGQKETRLIYSVYDGRTSNFFIYDLVDTTNVDLGEGDTTEAVRFRERHIYHFASTVMGASFSNIAYIENGEAVVFTAINCKDRGDDLSDVVEYLTPRLAGHPDSAGIMDRLKEYRDYGSYVAMDVHDHPNCDCDPCW